MGLVIPDEIVQATKMTEQELKTELAVALSRKASLMKLRFKGMFSLTWQRCKYSIGSRHGTSKTVSWWQKLDSGSAISCIRVF